MSEQVGELAKAYDPAEIEQKWAEYWVRDRVFATAAEGAAFTMLLPPPNVTGRLHMGHMLNQTEMDILARWHRMLGERALWVPGTDHAGIATQMMVEKQLLAEGTNRAALGREAFTDRVWDWKRQYGGAITGQMRRLGASVDWNREYFTMDEDLSLAVNEAFVRLYEQGLIYRGAYIVNWDPALETAVSDLEVESEELAGKLYSVRYPLADGTGSVVIATTRPETMLGDVAVAVNPNDARYTPLLGKLLLLPLAGPDGRGREIPIVADDWVNPEFGTGAVKVTPAHDPNDFAIGQRHNLPNITMLDKTAHVDLPGSPYHGLERYEARARIVADLDAAGLLVEVKDHAMTVPVSQRSGVVIEPRLSDQWFVRIQPLADNAIAAVKEGHVKIVPEMYEKTYFEWMGNIHDWCISRQLWWGHRIPAWHCAACKAITVSRKTATACSKCGAMELVQETDVLDTWFSSGLLPVTVFGWPSKDGKPTADMAAFYPTNVLVTGFDILFFWVARMIMLGTHFMLDVPMADGSQRTLKDAVPFREVYIHALVRAADRQKMSKTKGNVVDPISIIERFGTDAVRFTLASMASPGTDIAFSEERTDGYRAFANKIWNAARFLFMNLDRARECNIELDFTELASALAGSDDGTREPQENQQAQQITASLESKWILTRLSATAGAVEKALASYRFDEAANAVYQFFWGELCDWYLEIVKLRLKFDGVAEGFQGSEGFNHVEGAGQAQRDQTRAALTTFVAVFEAALRLLSPFMPFITEEIWHALWSKTAQGSAPSQLKSIALTRYPLATDIASDAASVTTMNLVQEVIVAVRGLRKEMGVPEKETARIRVFGSAAAASITHADVLAKMARVSGVEIAEAPLSGNGVRNAPAFDVQVVYERVLSPEDKAAERERLVRDIAKYEKGMAAAEKQLGNEGFMARAPAHIVEGLRRQAGETAGLLQKSREALEQLH